MSPVSDLALLSDRAIGTLMGGGGARLCESLTAAGGDCNMSSEATDRLDNLACEWMLGCCGPLRVTTFVVAAGRKGAGFASEGAAGLGALLIGDMKYFDFPEGGGVPDVGELK